MRNWEVKHILNNIAILLEMDDIQFKPRAYEKAARSIEALEEDVEDVYRRGGNKALMEIPGIGESIAEKIEELIKTERLDYYEKLKAKVPVDLDSLSGVEGLGQKRSKLYGKNLESGTLKISRMLAPRIKCARFRAFRKRPSKTS